MIFNNIRLYCTDWQTGRLEIRFICHHCGMEIEGEPKLWQYRIPRPNSYADPGDFRCWCDAACKKQDEEK